MVIDDGEVQDNKQNKIILHGAEYEKLKTAIIHTVKLFENQSNIILINLDMVAKHKDIVEYYIENNLDLIETTEQANELTIKLNAVIEKLINRDGILIVLADSDNQQERGLSLNINYDSPIFGWV